MIKYLLIAFILSGCSSIGGQSAYTVKPFEKSDGSLACCVVEVNNTKDYDRLDMTFTITKDGAIKFKLIEDGVDSSTPASIAAQKDAIIIESLLKRVPLGN